MSNLSIHVTDIIMHLLLDGWLKERLEQIGLLSILVMKLSGNSSQARKKEVMEIFGSG